MPVQGVLLPRSRFWFVARNSPSMLFVTDRVAPIQYRNFEVLLHAEVRSTGPGVSQSLCRFLPRVLALPGRQQYRGHWVSSAPPPMTLAETGKPESASSSAYRQHCGCNYSRVIAGLRELLSLTVQTVKDREAVEARTLC
jgi:hypothetical protein